MYTFSEEDVEKAVYTYRKGGTLKDVVNVLRIRTPETARRVLLENGVKIRHSGRPKAKVSLEDKIIIVNLYRKGYSLGTVSDVMGVSEYCIKAILIEANCKIRGPGRSTKMKQDKLEFALAAREYGYSWDEVKELLDASNYRVNALARKVAEDMFPWFDCSTFIRTKKDPMLLSRV